ncbi:hypothetical protein [Leyella stercorea]|uniref:hypothetical protein n=1 Tax=Leyella stercorea TaxID=363265 RepID=UPI00242D2DB6|nr:hypothetical protein [Leyella stercorea]
MFFLTCMVRIDRRRRPHRPTQMSASTDADVRIDRRGCPKLHFRNVKYVIKNAPSVILSDRRLCFLSAKDKTFSFWHTICISVSENINQLK